MATGTLPATAERKHDQYIERQLNHTRRQVKLVELSAALVVLVVGVLSFFLVAALIDHWLMPLGTVGRYLLLATLLGTVGWYLYAVLWPLLSRSINPVYAAMTIEQNTPTLKNSLINFLLLRSHRSDVHEVVYEAVEARAASDLAAVPVDTAMDYSKLIRVGYVLAAMFALCAAYKILSPKDPLQTIARVAAPWADIAKPSRVRINNITPGDVQQFFGDTVTVSADIRGLRSSEEVALYYSSVDGQATNQRLKMQLDSAGLHYTAKLPGEERGLQQSATYHVEAGDAVSHDYNITVVAAPTIIVEKLEYEYPRYTQKPRETRDRTGDIRAIEGTRVTIRAVANQPIQTASLQFDPGQNDATGKPIASKDVAMQVDGQTATATIVLELAADRTTPKHASYQLNFKTTLGHPGTQPALHTIDVLRDLSPEVSILAPEEESIEVPENSAAEIEVRAIDPDYALSRIGLKFSRGPNEIADKALFTASPAPVSSNTSKFRFRPSEMNLKAGDEIVYWATAADNRTAPQSGQPEPNTARTTNRFIKIIAADPAAKPEQGAKSPDNKQENEKKNDDKQPGENKNKQEGDKGKEKGMGGGAGDKEDMQEGSDPGEKGKEDMGKGGMSEMPMPGENPSPDNKGKGGMSKGTMGKEMGDKPMPGEEGKEPSEAGGVDGGNKSAAGNPDGMPPEGDPMGRDPGDNKQPNKSPGGMNKAGPDGANDKQNDTTNESGGDEQETPNGTGGKQGGKGKPSPEKNQNAHEGEKIEELLDRLKKEMERQEKNGQGGQPNAQQPSAEDVKKLTEEQKQMLRDLMKQREQKPESPDQAGGQNVPGPNGQDSKQGTGENKQPGTGETGKPGEKDPTTPDGTGDKPEAQPSNKQGTPQEKGQGGTPRPNENKATSPQSPESKQPMPGERQPGESTEPPAPTNPNDNTKKPSNTQGQEGGDREGQGKQGQGQNTKAPGNDNAGSTTPNEEGAKAANEMGKGETGEKGGDKEKAKGQTGSAGNEPGKGSTAKNPENKNGMPPDATGGEPSKEQSKDPMPGNNSGDNEQGKPGEHVTGGGKASDRTGRSPLADAEGPAAEKARLDYARKATDLVLDYLKDQKDKPDQKLLDDLGWSQADLQKFVQKWEAAKREAAANPAAKDDLDDALRSLGLRPVSDKVRSDGAKNDKNHGLGDTGTSSRPPSKYEEQFKAFKKGTARGN